MHTLFHSFVSPSFVHTHFCQSVRPLQIVQQAPNDAATEYSELLQPRNYADQKTKQKLNKIINMGLFVLKQHFIVNRGALTAVFQF